jgi:bacterioferritin
MHDQDTIQHLNGVLKNKLTAINQYFLHARILKHLGHVKLADQEYKASIDAMKHSDMLVEHILSLGGLPNLQELGNLKVGDTPEEMLQSDLSHALASVNNIKTVVASCESKANLASISLLKRLLENHKERIDFIHTQLAELNPIRLKKAESGKDSK